MNRSLRIAVADDEPDLRDYFQKILPRLGHQVVAAACGGRELLDACRAHAPDLVITDVKMPDMDGIDAAVAINQERLTPVILVSAYHDPALIERAEADHVLAFLVKPIRQAELETTIALALCRFEQLQALRREAADLRQALADRKEIEKAKGVLMKRHQLDEPEAYRKLQRLASERNLKLAEMARLILAADEVFPAP